MECFLPFISWLLENRVMRIMFELNTEELGGEGCIMWSFIICTAGQVVGYQRTVTKWVRMWHAWEWRYSWTDYWLGNGEERVHSEGLCDCRRILLKWILRNCISMDFDYSCFRRALSDILMNFVINHTLILLWRISW